MSAYQVMFRNNNAVSARKVNRSDFPDTKDFEMKGENLFIKWFIVESDNRRDAIEIADKVVKKIWGKELYHI